MNRTATRILAACALTCLLVLFVSAAFRQKNCSAQDIDSELPRNAPIDDALRILDGIGNVEGSVEKWTVVNPKEPASVQTSFGRFREGAPETYSEWRRAPANNREFSGKVTIFCHGYFSSDAIALTFVRGRLVQKDWGHLPG